MMPRVLDREKTYIKRCGTSGVPLPGCCHRSRCARASALTPAERPKLRAMEHGAHKLFQPSLRTLPLASLRP
eukprot:3616223-Pyramimonas_sp.AAC.1